MARFTAERSGPVLIVRFAHPPHDFLDSTAVRELAGIARRVDADPAVRAVVLTGARPGRFVTHFDAAELAAAAEFPAPRVPPWLGELAVRAGVAATWAEAASAAAERMGPLGVSLATLSRLHRIIRRLHRSSTVWVAAVGGPCLGAGLELALACDLRVAAAGPEVVFGQPEILAGIIPGAGGTQHLPRVLGTAAALELILEGRSIGAPEALAVGLVTRVVPGVELLPAALQVARRMATRPPAAVAAAKRAVWTGSTRGIGAGLFVEGGGLVAAGKSPETRRLAQAFADDLARLGESPFVADPAPWVSGERAGQE